MVRNWSGGRPSGSGRSPNSWSGPTNAASNTCRCNWSSRCPTAGESPGWMEGAPRTVSDVCHQGGPCSRKGPPEIDRHRKGAGLTMMGVPKNNEYGVWDTKEEEVVRLDEFLADRHSSGAIASSCPSSRSPTGTAHKAAKRQPRRQQPDPSFQASRTHCGSNHQLAARWYQLGHYWRCEACVKT